MECTAKSKRSQKPCRRAAMAGKSVCYNHGGKSLAGALSPVYKTGRWSKYLPQRFDKLLSAADGDLLDLTDDIAVIAQRIADVLKRVDTGESGTLWQKARETFDEFREAQADGDREKIVIALNALDSIFNRGAADYAAWNEVKALFGQRTKMVESQRKRAVEAHQMIATDEALEIMRYLAESVKRHVTDPATLANISADWSRFSSPSRLRLAG